MSAITNDAKATAIKNLQYLIQKLNAYGLDPKWATTTMTTDANNPALTYAIEKTAIQAALTAVDSTFSTWLT
jgi:hypothetical protein